MIENAPQIDYSSLPKAEREAAGFIQKNLYQLAYFVKEFTSTFELFQAAQLQGHALSQAENELITSGNWGELHAKMKAFAYERGRTGDWLTIAGRNGAITAYGFWMMTQSIYELLGRCPTLRAKHDSRAMKQSRKRFEAAFPGIASIRMSAAHPGELGARPDEIAKHYASSAGLEEFGIKVEGGAGAVFLSSHKVIDDEGMTYSATFGGKVVSYRLSERSIAELGQVADQIWDAFWPTAPAALQYLRRERP
jgi:hypothetical protein